MYISLFVNCLLCPGKTGNMKLIGLTVVTSLGLATCEVHPRMLRHMQVTTAARANAGDLSSNEWWGPQSENEEPVGQSRQIVDMGSGFCQDAQGSWHPLYFSQAKSQDDCLKVLREMETNNNVRGAIWGKYCAIAADDGHEPTGRSINGVFYEGSGGRGPVKSAGGNDEYKCWAFATSATGPNSQPPIVPPKPIVPPRPANQQNHLPAEIQEMLDQHNHYRCLHGVPEMTWDANLATSAKSWADKMERVLGGNMGHSCVYPRTCRNDPDCCVNGEQYGENIGMGTPTATVEMWYGEIDKTYPRGIVKGFGGGTGHYTQVVWKDSIKLGCGKGQPMKKYPWHDLWVCQYQVAGNMGGQYEKNVAAPLRNPSC